MELRDYLRIIRRRWLLITLCTLVVVGAAAGLTYTATPQYASTAQLNISTPESSLDAAYQGTLTSQQKVQTYATLITGTLVAQASHRQARPRDESAEALAAQVSSSVDPETTLLNVTVTDPSPGRARQLAQATADEFVAYVPEIESAQTPIKASDHRDAHSADQPGVASTGPQPRAGARARSHARRRPGRAARHPRHDREVRTHADRGAPASPCWAASSTTPRPASTRSSPASTRTRHGSSRSGCCAPTCSSSTSTSRRRSSSSRAPCPVRASRPLRSTSRSRSPRPARRSC